MSFAFFPLTLVSERTSANYKSAILLTYLHQHNDRYQTRTSHHSSIRLHILWNENVNISAIYTWRLLHENNFLDHACGHDSNCLRT